VTRKILPSCNQGCLDVETDGDTWHLGTEHVAHDNRRNNGLAELGWQVLRFNTLQIQEQCAEYCLPSIQATLNRLGGLKEDGLVPRKFIDKNGESAQQLSLFEQSAPYATDTDEEELD